MDFLLLLSPALLYSTSLYSPLTATSETIEGKKIQSSRKLPITLYLGCKTRNAVDLRLLFV
jgi:hypothetical protein